MKTCKEEQEQQDDQTYTGSQAHVVYNFITSCTYSIIYRKLKTNTVNTKLGNKYFPLFLFQLGI